jgi:hypothetical protein
MVKQDRLFIEHPFSLAFLFDAAPWIAEHSKGYDVHPEGGEGLIVCKYETSACRTLWMQRFSYLADTLRRIDPFLAIAALGAEVPDNNHRPHAGNLNVFP